MSSAAEPAAGATVRPSLRQVSIRIKLAVLASAVVVLVVLGQTLQSLSKEAVAIQEEIGLGARLITMSLAASASDAWSTGEQPDMQRLAERASRDLDIRTLALVDTQGQLVAAYGEPPSAAEIERVTRLRLRSMPRSLWALAARPSEFATASPVIEREQVRGYLLCVFRSDAPLQRLRALLWGALWSTGFWVALGAGLTLLVTGRLTRPLVALAEDLGEIGESGYRVPEEGLADGEIGLVQERLAELWQRLERERERVDDLTRRLSHQVDVVSADLERVAQERQVVLDTVRDGILLVDAEGRVRSVNDPARELLGGRARRRKLWELLDGGGRLPRALERVRSLHRPQLLRVDTRSDPPRNLRVKLVPLRGELEERYGVMAVLEDVTETQRLEELMHRSESLAALGTLSAGLAHQIGNHLSAIKGYADLVARRVRDDHELSADLEVIAREVREATGLMDRMLLLARTRPALRQPLQVATLLEEALTVIRPKARQQGVSIQTRLPGTSCVMEGEPHLFQQALMNIFVNALQAMPEGGSLRVGSQCTADGHCRISVADTGPGIPADVRARIFEPFYTTKPVGQGTGLGLSITHRILELHGAEIDVESEPGHGTTFWIDLPPRSSDAPSDTVPQGEQQETT